MTYLVCYVWRSTLGNHTGMAHMCDLLENQDPEAFRVLKYNQRAFYSKLLGRRISKRILRLLDWWEEKKIECSLRHVMRIKQPEDKIYFTEYLHPSLNQLALAQMVKRIDSCTPVYGMAHLTPTMLDELNTTKESIREWNQYVDYFVTLGGNLTDYLVKKGVPADKIITTRHYVDRAYYQVAEPKDQPFRVIVMGSMQRNYRLIEQIVAACPQIPFVVCAGRDNLSQFAKYKNVTLLGYLSEDDLRNEMAQSTVSLSVMEDTVGSNVIVTSMAMGLCQVVSDVGAIRDYCSEDNAQFCRTTEEYIEALNYLYSHPKELLEMRMNAVEASQQYSLGRFINDVWR